MNKDVELFGTIYKRGEIIVSQGDRGDTMYIIQSGAVEVRQRQGDKDVVLALLEQGDFFGEMALLDDEPRSATVTALRRTRLLALSRSSLLVRLRQDPGVALHLLKTLSHRIEKNNRLVKKRMEAGEAGRPASSAGPRDGGDEARPPAVPLPGPAPEKDPSPSLERQKESPPEGSVESECVWFEPRQVLFHQGEPGDTMYVIMEGMVEIIHGQEGTVLARLGPNDYLGEMALFTCRPRTASAVSVVRTKLLPIKRDEFLDRIREKPELALYILQTLVKRLRKTSAVLNAPKGAIDFSSVGMPTLLRRSGKASMAIVSLSTCSGCASTLLDDHEALAALVERANVIYCPLLMDEHDFSETDITVVDGLVRSKEDAEKLEEVRHKSRYLVAWGTCASFGGIPAMANQYELEDLIDEAYGRAQDTFAYYLSGARGVTTASYRDTELALLRRAMKLDDVVKVDYYVPGCPPRAGLLTGLLQEMRGEQLTAPRRPLVCSECSRRPRKDSVDCFRLFPPAELEASACFPASGTLCLGFLTRGGCGAPCTAGGLPCWGCRGLSDMTLQKMGKGDTFDRIMLDSLVRRSKLSEEHLKPIMNIIRNRANSSLNYSANHTIDGTRIR
jgi:F420-non-reducing hydrogenase small subunit